MSQAEFDEEFDRTFFANPNEDEDSIEEDIVEDSGDEEDDYFDLCDEIDADMSLAEDEPMAEPEEDDIDDETYYAETLDFA